MDKFDQLHELVRSALGKVKGCEWLKSKSIQEVASYTLEEAYELIDAIENKNPESIKDELADLVFHLVLYAEMADKRGDFSLEDVLESALEKQRSRRLSLEKKDASAEEAHAHWRAQKIKTRKKEQESEGLLADIPKNMPALVHSKKIQDRVGDIGFDWDNIEEIFIKLNEELEEFKVEYEVRDSEAMLDEMGDIFFTLVNIGRHLDIDAEQALRHANNKFMRRFRLVETTVEKQGQLVESMGFNDLLEVWKQVKKEEKI